MKILLVGFQEFDEKMYPHTQYFVNLVKEKIDIDYFNAKEKGFFFSPYIDNPFSKEARNATRIAFKNLFKTIFRVKKLDIKNNYDYILVIDDFNFWGLSFFIKKSKLVYYSYDFYAPETPLGKLGLIKLITKHNNKLLKKGIPSIIQCEDRKNDFEEATQIKLKNVFYIPIFAEKIQGITPAVKISTESPVLMQFGAACNIRMSDKLIKNCIENNFAYSLHMHGNIEGNIKDMAKEANSPNIIYSEGLYSADEYNQTLKRADIGFICYSFNHDSNNKHLFRANGRIPEFLKMAKPIISIQNEDIAINLNKYKIGISINSIEEVPRAIEEIKNNYAEYSENALKCFNEVFNHELYVDNFVEWLKNLHSK